MGERNKSRSLGSLQWNIDTSVRSKSANCKVLKFCTKIEGPKHLFTLLFVPFELQEEFKKHLAGIPESLQTIEVRDKIFHEVLGEDGHGCCKTFGAGVPRRAGYGQCSSPSHASSSSTANEITRQVREATQEIEQRLSVEIEQRLTGEIEKKLTEEIEQRLTGEIERRLDDMFMAHLELPNVASGQSIIREPVGNDYIQDGEQVGSPLPTHSPRLGQEHHILPCMKDQMTAGNFHHKDCQRHFAAIEMVLFLMRKPKYYDKKIRLFHG
ncbi:hypothetical protein Vadar_018757 [Vaccinium darrowii]|nr:hypothetical protein Vadar_018757 [Vaccinium darrowii]